MLVIFVLKLRMAEPVVDYLDESNYIMYTLLYGGAYFMTLAGLLLLIVYYAFFRKRLLLSPMSSVILPGTAMGLFVLSLICEAILLFVYNVGIEANIIRTVVMRPVFYFGFIGLSAYFLRRSS